MITDAVAGFVCDVMGTLLFGGYIRRRKRFFTLDKYITVAAATVTTVRVITLLQTSLEALYLRLGFYLVLLYVLCPHAEFMPCAIAKLSNTHVEEYLRRYFHMNAHHESRQFYTCIAIMA